MGKRGPGSPPLEIRFWEKVEKTDTCWIWTASTNRKTGGYGQIGVGRKRYMAHRLSYEWARGPIADGFTIDHVCHNTLCVNPDHLRAVTQKQNSENRSGAARNNKHSGIRGVHWHGPSKSWHVVVGHTNRKVSGGYYRTLEEAAKGAEDLRNYLYTHNDLDRVGAA